ncbi:anti-phage-associated DUF1156 domain-containing protein [Bradyrhizobium sp. RP6]|uniref:anti-phage-associated DUF1156 domain-containing protein n=1 Tax=Bradyrhizobium sp. RP6 TaxID=2489596 RepID=UPI000F54264A|nr:anti-phage-associated DUF1156 domain-containing protein [Bradyrhizobium sp. RP6]RQH12685.1 DUF1156 domain-containing protein [Bradyrhizobium sp. RP6]
MDAVSPKSSVVPFSLKDTPSLIEGIFPVQKLSAEAQKERLGAQSQTLTPLGSYWKGRKPLILVRACIIASLLPPSGDDALDLDILEKLIGLHDEQIFARLRDNVTVDEIVKWATPAQRAVLLDEAVERGKSVVTLKRGVERSERDRVSAAIISNMPYITRVEKLARPEEVDESLLLIPYLQRANELYGTDAKSLPELVDQLGTMRFGHRPRVGDTFSGGGSIPFEAARIGCDVYASDLNPIACMLTWGALNIIGADQSARKEFERAQADLMRRVDDEVTKLGVEFDKHGNRAKAYLYCLEVKCPQTQWVVPIAPTWVISKGRRTVGKLVPDKKNKRFDIELVFEASDAEMSEAEKGTLRSGTVVYTIGNDEYRTPLKTIRGDYKGPDGTTANGIRKWDKSDISFRANDVFTERLFAVQWITKETLESPRQETYLAAPTELDLQQERKVQEFVKRNLADWQASGFVPDMMIEPGENTSQPIRERGWTYWHHLFSPRELLIFGLMRKLAKGREYEFVLATMLARSLDWNSRLCRWRGSVGKEANANTFSNMALNTLANTVSRGLASFGGLSIDVSKARPIRGEAKVANLPANDLAVDCDMFITDPPYADAVNYHEITEFFISWLRKGPPKPFNDWIWDSRRPLAIKGDGEEFRHNMVAAYTAMANHMPENGIQIVMFTHQSASVWADMAQIFWGAGLQVMAAWYIATETTSELKKGGYVQGTVILVLRKRKGVETGYKDEIVQEVRAEVAEQIDTMVGLNQTLKGSGRAENLFEDADLQMAGYAAALRVLTRYAKIDGVDMTKEALRPRRKGEKDIVGEVIDFSVQVANEHMVPEHMPSKLWERLTGPERFYLKMMDIETTSLRKLDNYQNFAKAFRVADYGDLMGSVQPNKARLKTAKEFKKVGFEIPEFGPSATRAVLYAIYELENDVEGDEVLSHLRDMLPSYHHKRDDLAAVAEYIARKREKVDETESRAARILHGLIRNERLG